jgi:glycerate dehydrogenase
MNIVTLDGHTLSPGDNSWSDIAGMGNLTVFDRTPIEQIVARAADADIVITNKAPLGAETLGQLPTLKCITVTATGYNIVDIETAGKREIPVCNVPEYGSNTVAEFAFALILELAHHIGRHHQSVVAGEWQHNSDWCYWLTPQLELAGKTIGIIGFGRIGRRVGDIAHAFGMNVLAHDLTTSSPPGYQPFSWRSIQQLFSEADIVTVHCPQTPQNTKFINRALLEMMKPSAFLINAARGGLVNERDLADALNAGTIAGAAVDVVSAEPIRADNPLLSAKTCLLTPHMAWTTIEARQRIMKVTAENIAAFISGRPQNVVNAAFIQRR